MKDKLKIWEYVILLNDSIYISPILPPTPILKIKMNFLSPKARVMVTLSRAECKHKTQKNKYTLRA